MTRVATLMEAAKTWHDMHRHDGPEDRKADVITNIIWTACGLAGAVGFFGSFALLATPLFGWSWLAAGYSFLIAQWVSCVLLEIPTYWKKAASWFWILKQLATRKNILKELQDRKHLSPRAAPSA